MRPLVGVTAWRRKLDTFLGLERCGVVKGKRKLAYYLIIGIVDLVVGSKQR